MAGYDPRLSSLQRIGLPETFNQEKSGKTKQADKSFDSILKEKRDVSGLEFSQHAQARLRSSGIKLNAEQVQQLEEAVAKARSKQAKETLVVMEDTAFVVSVKNNTVVTVIDSSRMKENVFTNIDSAVIT